MISAAEICYSKGFPLRKACTFLFIFFAFFTDGFGQNPANVPTYDFDGEVYWGSAGENSTDSLTIAIDTDSADNIYRLTFGKGILKSDPDGQNETEFISPDFFDSALDFAIDSNDNFFIIDFEDQEPFSDNGKIKKFNKQGESLPSETIYTSSFRPLGITIDSDDYLYVAMYNDETTGGDSEEISQIRIYDSQGIMVGSPFGGSPMHPLDKPYRLAVDSEKNIFISHSANDGEVIVFDSDFNYLDILDDNVEDLTEELDILGTPGSIVIDKAGFIHIIDYRDFIDFQQILNYQNLTDTEFIILALGIVSGVSAQEFNIKIYNSDRELEDSFHDYSNEKLKLPVDLAFDNCGTRLYIDNANPNINYFQIEKSTINFSLLKYNRSPEITCNEEINTAPEGNADNYSTDFETILTINADSGVLINDTDAEGDNLSAVLVDGVTDGTLTLNSDGSFTYVPDSNFSGTDTFTYKASDGELESGVVTVSIVVGEAPNTAPEGNADNYSTDFETILTVNADNGVLANDTDTEGDNLSAVLVDGATDGTLTLNSDGSFNYVPDSNFSGTDTFTYKASDGELESGVVTVSIVVGEAPNTAPEGNADNYSTDFETILTVNADNGVLANDTDTEGDNLSAVLVDGATDGTLTLNSDGSFNYVPDSNFSGTDTFTYKASDGELESGVVTVTIVVGEAPNTAPEANGDDYSTPFETTLTVSAANGVLINDTDAEGDNLSAILVDDVTNGTLDLISDGSFTYVPDGNSSGSDTFTYKASDGELESGVVTVTIVVGEAPNTAPEANGDDYSTPFETTLTVSAANGVLSNDSDPNGDALTVQLRTDVSDGTLNLNEDGSFTYTPDTGFNGEDTFTYIANDGELGSNEVTVTITVNPDPNQAPIAVGDSYPTDFETTLTVSAANGVLSNDIDPDGDALTAQLQTDVSNGTLNLNENGSFAYTPDAGFSGEDAFSYLATDGELNSDVVTVTITVNPQPNQAPIGLDDQYSVSVNQSLTIEAPGVLENDNDPDGDNITSLLQSDVSNGILNLDQDGAFSYTPNTDFTGEDTFTYVANDGALNSGLVTVRINVTAALTINCPSDKTESLDAGCSYSVPDYTSLAVVTNGDGAQVTQEPVEGTLVTDSQFEVRLRVEQDGASDECTFLVNLEDTSAPEALCVGAYDITLNEGETVTLDPSQIDDGSTDSCSAVNLSLDKTEFTSADEGANTVTLTVTDEAGNVSSCEATVQVTVTNIDVNQPPVAYDEEYTTEINTSLNVPASNGVLVNDTDPENDELTAVLDTDVENGTLQLNADGSFTYTPDTDFVGQDFFTYKANDGEYDSNTIFVSINVVDSSGEFSCSSQVVLGLGPEGEAILDINLLYTGNSEDIEFSADQLLFDCDDIGENTVTLTYTGRLDGTCEIPVMVVDDAPPVLQLRDISIDLNLQGVATISFEDINNGSYDECDVDVTYTLSKMVFSCKDLGENIIQVTAEDESGNTATASAIIRVFAEKEICTDPLPGPEYIFIYPNPNSGSFKVATPGDVTIQRIEVFDKRGRFITARNYATTDTEYAMHLVPLQEAVYILKLVTNEGIYIKRMIFKR